MSARSAAFLLVVTLALAPAAAWPASSQDAGSPPFLVASGPGEHVLVEDHLIWKTCREEGVVTLTHNAAAGRTFIDVTGDGCAPTFSLLERCQGVGGDGWFRCDRRVGGGQINATLSPEGVFVFAWDAPDFTERIWANMTRLG